MMRWLCIALGILGFVVAYRLSGGDLLISLSISLAPMTALIGIKRGLAAEKERKASSLTEQQFMLQKAGGAKNLRHQALLIRICSYMLILVAVPMLIVGVGAATQGNITAFLIALAAMVVLYGARMSLKAARKMRAAASEA